MEEYITQKQELLRDFCIPNDVIESAPWHRMKSEIEIDNLTITIIRNNL